MTLSLQQLCIQKFIDNIKTLPPVLKDEILGQTRKEIEKDIKASKLTAMLFDAGLKDKSSKIAIDIWTNDDGTINIDKFQNFLSKANEILLMKDDNSIFRNELACMTSV